MFAGLKPRLIAFGYDYLIIWGIMFVVSLIGSFVAFGPFQDQVAEGLSTPVARDTLAFVTLILPVMLYFALQESSVSQGTWGKRKARVRVQTLAGERMNFGRSFIRSAVKFLPWQIAHTCLFNIPSWPVTPEEPPAWVLLGFGVVWALVGINFGMLVWSKTHRTLYDWVAGTVVVSKTVN